MKLNAVRKRGQSTTNIIKKKKRKRDERSKGKRESSVGWHFN